MIILDTLRANGSSQTTTHPEVVTFVLRAKLFQEPWTAGMGGLLTSGLVSPLRATSVVSLWLGKCLISQSESWTPEYFPRFWQMTYTFRFTDRKKCKELLHENQIYTD